jgi:xylulokinase
MSLLLGLDIGTSSIKAGLYDAGLGRVVRLASRPTPVEQPVPGWSEHDPEALYQTVVSCIREVAMAQPVVGLAASSFAEAGLPLDSAGRPIYPVIAWYDRRTEPQAAWWEATLPLEDMHAITGQRSSPSFGVNKWLWIRENVPGAAAQMSKWLSVPDYILWRLTGEQATDYTMASRTLLFDQRQLNWSDEILGLAGLDVCQLPRVLPGGTPAGAVTRQAAAETGLPVDTVCVLGGHDHLCASFAVGAHRPGVVIDSSGTAQALLALVPGFHTSPHIVKGGYACYAHVVPGQYVLKGGLKAAGGVIDWWARQLSGPDAALSDDVYAALEESAAASVGRWAGPVWLPHLIGSGTPEGDRHSRGALVGVQIEHNRGDLFRGMLESLAFWVRHNLGAMEMLTGQPVEQVMLLGGTTRLRLLTQIKADVLDLPVAIPDVPEAAVTGAALLAGLGAGVFQTPAQAVDSLQHEMAVRTPDPSRAAWYDQMYRQVYAPLYGALQDVHHAMKEIERTGSGAI